MASTPHATVSFKDLNEFLAKHSAKNTASANSGQIATHTRIPNKELNIYGGSYVIPAEELDTFYQLYYEHVFEQKKKEYLTERQQESGGPLVVDFDFRYQHSVAERKHTPSHVVDIICTYLDALKNVYTFTENTPFYVFVFEKPTVNRLEDGSLTKDGIHLLFGIQTDHIVQMMIREEMLKTLPEILSDLPLINTWDAVLDEGISKGCTNWQLFGSRKPACPAYELTQYWVITYDASDGNFMMDERKPSEFQLKRDFAKVSVQCTSNPKFEMNPKFLDAYNRQCQLKKSKAPKKPASNTRVNRLVADDETSPDEEHIPLEDIVNEEVLQRAVQLMLKGLHSTEYDVRETHEYTQALPPAYYEPGSHVLNRMVAFALKHTDERLFLSWVLLRSKASDFDYATIPALYKEWRKFPRSNQNGKTLNRRSIRYWVRHKNPTAYANITNETVDYYLEKAMETNADYDFGMILRNLFGDEYVCVSYEKRGGVWYKFRNHRWTPDKGLSLREKISKDLYNLFGKKSEQCEREMSEYSENDERREFLKKKVGLIHQIKIKLKQTVHKDHIMREAAEIFYDENFIKNMDVNKYLLCFNNGVVDFKTKQFRDGQPDDYITKCTRIDYVPYNPNDPDFRRSMEELEHFMNTVFPIPDLKRYMWDHLSSCLIGVNKNQTFNVYHGSGSNGKTLIVDLMSAVLGDYKGTVPITLVTDARVKIGSTSSEIMQLKGLRYAVMQEPSKNMKLNEGIMKELTGDDPIQARGMYLESETFEPQFKLVVCTNNLFDVESNDDGTWRRIRKCTFPAKFVDDGETYEDDTPYVFKKDKSLSEKLHACASVFASMLVKRAFETDGIVEDCVTILEASKKYRNGQDHLAAFIAEKIRKVPGDPNPSVRPERIIKKTTLLDEFKLWFQREQGTRKMPKGEELYECMRKKFGDISKKWGGWINVEFVQEEAEVDVLDAI